MKKGLVLAGKGKQDAELRTGLLLSFCGKLILVLHLPFEREAKVERAVDPALLS